jgi:hypothetical protein
VGVGVIGGIVSMGPKLLYNKFLWWCISTYTNLALIGGVPVGDGSRGVSGCF